MPTPPLEYSQFFLSPTHHMSTHSYPLHNNHHDSGVSPPHSDSPQIPLDPALALYQPPFYQYQQHQLQMQPQNLVLDGSHSSPSSQGSESQSTPPAEYLPPMASSTKVNGKRPAPSMANGSASGSRKKSRKDDDDEAPSPSAEKEEGKVKPTRGSRACTVCRRLKMKCVGAEQGPPCKRCQAGNHECIFEESNRGKRSSKKHELLTRSLRKMERTLDTVLRSISNPGVNSVVSGMVSRSPSPSAQSATTQALLAASPVNVSSSLHSHPGGNSPKLHSLPDNALNPLGLLAEASLANRRAQINQGQGSSTKAADSKTAKFGVASDIYFKPGPMTILPLRRLYIERQVQPEMLSFVRTEEVVELFRIFFTHVNLHCSLLEESFHTPSLVCSRSPFLLTTICAIASKYYTQRPELHVRLAQLARKLSFSVPERGYKSVEIVQAYLLLTWWGINPVERYEHEQTWLLLGMGIRMATDLNLHRKTNVTGQDTPEARARDKEVHNRERTWMACFILDRSYSAQMGKPHSIKEDYIIRNADQWWRSPLANPSDSGIAAYVELQRILSRSLDFLYSGITSASGLQMECDYLLVVKTIETQLQSWQQTWMQRETDSGANATVSLVYRRLIGRFYFYYAMLVVNSFGLQNALERSAVDIGYFFTRCHSSAISCAMIVRDELGPQGYLKYSPDSHFVQCSYAVLTLLKLIRPEFQAFLDNENKTISLVKDMADLLESIAVSPTHTPALYGTFVRALIAAKVDSSVAPSSPARNSFGEGSAASCLGQVPQMNGYTSTSVFKYPLSNGTPADAGMSMSDFSFAGEMGPVADISTFPPTMAPVSSADDMGGMLSMDSILSSTFWDSVLVPGFSNTLEGLSGGFVYGAGGSGLITPRLGSTPLHSGTNTPLRSPNHINELTQNSFNAALHRSSGDGTKIGS